MKAKIPAIKSTKKSTVKVTAIALGKRNFAFKNAVMGNNNTENKKANNTGVKIFLPMQKI